jgi:hypothetical protein
MWKWIAVAGAVALTGCATNNAAVASGETGIPFVASNGILEWRAASEDLLYIRGFDGKWYQLRTMGKCARLLTATALSFDLNVPGELDRHGAIIAEGWRCPLASVTRSDAPPANLRSS